MVRVSALGLGAATLLSVSSAAADPSTPAGAHPRLFMSASQLAAYKKNAPVAGTAAAYPTGAETPVEDLALVGGAVAPLISELE